MFETLFKKSILGKKNVLANHPLTVDVHAHLLPQLDDGASSVEQSIAIIKGLQALGYKKIIATPHVMSGFYNNSYDDILQSLYLLRGVLKRYNIQVELDASAEYYLEDSLFDLIERNEILSFGGRKKYLLFEASFVTKPSEIVEAARRMQKAGYIPVLAHPERYIALNNIDTLTRLLFNGILFQVNIGSVTGYYSKQAQDMAEMLIKKNMVAFFGTNCHNEAQLKSIKTAFELPHFCNAARENVLNNSLMEMYGTHQINKIYSRA